MNFLERVDELMQLGWSEADACRTAKAEERERLMREYIEACDEIAAQCREEGYPDHGSNYELRTESLWEEYYLPAIEALEDSTQGPAEIELIDSTIDTGNTDKVYTDQAIPER